MLYMKSANINVRIDEGIYKRAREMNINLSETVREALIAEIERRKVKAIMEELDTASKAVKKMGVSNIVREIRETREKR